MTTVKSINIIGLHGRLDLDLSFFPDTTVIFGKNGASKTTTLHIITNILAGDVERFAYIDFSTIDVNLSNGDKIQLASRRTTNDRMIEVSVNDEIVVNSFSSRGIKREINRSIHYDYEDVNSLLRRVRLESQSLPKVGPTYFPAFRSALEGMEISREQSWRADAELNRLERRNELSHTFPTSPRHRRERQASLTRVAREAFGPFVPAIQYASTRQIIGELRNRIREATFELAQLDRSMLSDAFARVFDAIGTDDDSSSDSADQLLEEIRGLLQQREGDSIPNSLQGSSSFFHRLSQSVKRLDGKEVGESLEPMLRVYRDSLRDRIKAQEGAFREINLYIETVNKFLEGKQLSYSNQTSTTSEGTTHVTSSRFSPQLDMPDGSVVTVLSLSSGERQILSLLYATVFQSDQKQQLVLIDEPEISLHIDWQRMLIKTVSDQLKNSQLVVFTHSPEIASMFPNKLVEISPRPTEVSEDTVDLDPDRNDELEDEDIVNDVPF